MQTAHDVYPAIITVKPIRFDKVSGHGTCLMQVDDREPRVEVRRQIEAYVLDEYASTVVGIYLQERLWDDVRYYQIPVRVVYYCPLGKLANH